MLTGATVNDNGTASINVNDTNIITNNGAVSAGSGLTGINGGNFNTVTNNRAVAVLDNGLGISMLDNNTSPTTGRSLRATVAPRSRSTTTTSSATPARCRSERTALAFSQA
ncbi:hypothetical protein ACVWXO_002829 [Bradyrhizobium sp. LM2.7]